LIVLIVVPSASAGLISAPEVAVGGRLKVRAGHVALPASLEVRGRRGGWQPSGPRIKRPRQHVVLRAPAQPGYLRIRARGSDDSVTPVKRVRVRYLHLDAVGDINLGDGPGTAIAFHGPKYPWRSVGRVLRRADIAFGNLECAVSRRGHQLVKEFTFRGRPSSLRAAARTGGLDVVNLANNHAGDYGDTALVDTLRFAHRYGIATTGAGRDEREAYRPTIVEKLGLRVAFVGFSTILPFEFRAGPHDPGTAWGFDDRVRDSVRRAARHADVVIATFHWGIERDFHSDAQQRALAHVALQAGATAVIAGHPHVQQEIVRRRNRVIAYSLGNFVFSANTPGTESTGILQLHLARQRVASSPFRRATIYASRPILQ
jgi:poly-gamma-glutamate synthesis protein (capsule biosynthesis protein)